MSKLMNEMIYEELIVVIVECNEALSSSFKRGAEARVYLHRMGRMDPKYARGPWAFYREIYEGKLDVNVALTAEPAKLKCLLPFPPAQQLQMATGLKKIKLVDHNEKGNLVVVEVTLAQMSAREVTTAFNETGFRPIAEQKKIVAARGTDTRRSTAPLEIRADLQTEEVVVGRIRIPVADLYAPLKKLGFKLTRIERPAARKASQENRASF